MKIIKIAVATSVMFTATFAVAYAVSVVSIESIYSHLDTVYESADLQEVCLQMAGSIAIVPAIIVFAFGLKQRQLKQQRDRADEWQYQQVLQRLPYKRGWLLTIPEKKLWNILKAVIPKNQYVVAKPCLKEFIKVQGYNESAVNRRAWREIAQKHVDFLVCKKSNMYPLYAIEYDGQTHDPGNPANATTIESDYLKNRIFARIGMPLLRIEYEKSEYMLEQQVKRLLAEKIRNRGDY